MLAPPGTALVLPALLTVTGAAALLHESVWFRLLVPWLGAGARPAAAVSAGALLGLAAGAAAGGAIADRVRRPARVLAAAEGAAAVACALVPVAIEALSSLSGLTAILAATLVLALAATPMGASLPAAVRLAAASREVVGSRFRRLYAWNTAGAVLGTLAGAAVVLETLGDRGTILAASVAQALAALTALALRAPATEEAGPAPTLAGPPAPRRHAWAAALAGAAGLVVQVAWIRRLTPVIGSTYQVFACVLAVHLAAIALGSAALGPRRGTGPARVLFILAGAAAVAVAVGPALVEPVARGAAARAAAAQGGFAALLWVRVEVAAALVLVPAALGAAILPWLVRAASPSVGTAGRAAGALLAANTAGSAVGALLAALAWIPSVGTAATLRGAAGLYAAVAALSARPRAVVAAATVGAAALLAQPWVAPVVDVAGRDAIGCFYDPSSYEPRDTRTLRFEEGAVATVVVRDRDGRKEFWVDGSIESSTGPTDRLHLGLLGHLPMAIATARGHARADVTVIGLGAGLTAQAVAAWSPRDLEVFEIEPAVARAAPWFARDGGGVPDDARLRIGDGRKGLRDGPAGRHVVTSDPVHPAVAGSAYLYSLEHYRDVLDRLAQDGVACQWLPLAQMVEDDLRLVVRTFAAAFPAPYLFLAGADGILVGSRVPLRLDEERLRTALEGRAGAGLGALGLRAPGRLLGLLALDSPGCRRFAGEGPLNTDDRLLLESRGGRHLWSGDPAANARAIESIGCDPASLLAAPPSPRFRKEAEGARRFSAAMAAWVAGDFAAASEAFRERATADPADRFARAMRDEAAIEAAYALEARGRGAEALALARGVLAAGEADTILRLDAAELLERGGDRDGARAAARDVLKQGDWPRARRLAGE